ncbi:MAG: hypothetical protein ACWGON_01555, partial [Gemmatimonadota bacterium]
MRHARARGTRRGAGHRQKTVDRSSVLGGASPALADTTQILWTFTFDPPITWDNLMRGILQQLFHDR